jgi:trehalose transport system substrate-binding protein
MSPGASHRHVLCGIGRALRSGGDRALPDHGAGAARRWALSEIYFLPARPNVQITYDNDARFNDWGVQPPKSGDELSAAAKTIHEQAGVGKVSIQGVPTGPVGVTVTRFVWQACSDPLQINNDAGVQAFAFMQNLKPDLTPQYPTATFDTTSTYLLNERVVLAQNWPFGINVIVQTKEKKDVKTYGGWSGPQGAGFTRISCYAFRRRPEPTVHLAL